ncbi:MAG: Ig-like domain-containing protein [Bacteroidales bacterium]|nr:Ig-like domain-containing protein [Bacteroidales bacterium]
MKKISIPATLIVVAIIMMAVFSSCKEEPDFSYTPLPVSGAVIHSTHDTIAIGDVLALRGNTVPMNATNQAVTWFSSESGIASVNNEGVVTGVALGTATITMTTAQGGYTDTSLVTVIPVPIPVTGVTLDRDSVEIVSGQTQTLVRSIIPENATVQGVTWRSSDTAIAVVNNAGLVTARAVGVATITVRTNNGGLEAETVVTVTPILVTGVSLSGLSTVWDSTDIGETAQLTATVAPTNATNRDVVWSSSDRSVATVSQTGLVTAVGQGRAMIMVVTVCGRFSAIREVSVGEEEEACIPTVGPPTAANIVTFCPDPDAESLTAFLNAGTPTVYYITQMSSRLQAWVDAYRTAVATMPPVVNTTFSGFDTISISLPFSALPIVGGLISARALSVNIHYTSTPNVWPFASTNVTATLTAMTGTGNNPNSDVTFPSLSRRDRTGASTSAVPPRPATPHSTSPPTTAGGNGFDQTAGSDAFNAILGIFSPTGFANTAARDTPLPDGNLIGLLSSPTGWTIIQENATTFWFRSKADPTDWFVVVRQP